MLALSIKEILLHSDLNTNKNSSIHWLCKTVPTLSCTNEKCKKWKSNSLVVFLQDSEKPSPPQKPLPADPLVRTSRRFNSLSEGGGRIPGTGPRPIPIPTVPRPPPSIPLPCRCVSIAAKSRCMSPCVYFVCVVFQACSSVALQTTKDHRLLSSP